ncbi:Heptaprenyl diphosphate synthase component II [Candidatus Syntrophocurvum alkaliphilum]|uniref:Heptaprenyl diphosphate synthase component II n=1 Tax=Candidatus Syntrophocurvum alkaliphilum TaxID=2293317 RepID=A0A6I6DBL3_9FIRM|nr:polyprenyl synthetase family protein [Candidatus Syntrophocurvum alkaliphilum]QGT99679.1 Heptaprenyl diphosphate synthase component II [Candidatus Syntrophocurvum alkaliphilum]
MYPFSEELIINRIKEVLITGNNEIDKVFTYILESNGKMLRPRLIFLTASLYNHKPEVVKDIAVAVELIHLASLIHDDVIDKSLKRRGRDSVNAVWNNQVSVLAGDYLFATAFNLINRYGLPSVLENITETIQTMCAGEINQMALAYNLDINEDDYYLKTYQKTSCLFASSSKIGALISSAPKSEVIALENFGKNLGYAYQIIDDVLDFVSDSQLLGKPAGNDLIQGNITLPVIYALKNEGYSQITKTLIQECQIPEKMDLLIDVLWESKSIDQSVLTSQEFLNLGVNHISTLANSTVRKELELLAYRMLEHYYKKIKKVNMIAKKGAVQKNGTACSLNY